MARYRNDPDEERDYSRNERFERERPWNYNDPYAGRSRSLGDFGRERFGGGRFGERADYEHDEPRYSGYSGQQSREDYGRPHYGYGPDYGSRRYEEYEQPARSRLRCRDIMTRDLVVATRDTTLREVAMMMKDEDTGVIPVVEYEVPGRDGKSNLDERRQGGTHGYGKLVGLITDRDIVIRAGAEDKDCRTTRAEEIMSTDLYMAKPNDRVVDVIRKMADKQVRRIPVVGESGPLKGMISLGDIAIETEEDLELAEALEEISRRPSFWSRIF